MNQKLMQKVFLLPANLAITKSNYQQYLRMSDITIEKYTQVCNLHDGSRLSNKKLVKKEIFNSSFRKISYIYEFRTE